MKPEIKEKWVAALRSGEYRQTTGRLRRSGLMYDQTPEYCCLGVLCDVLEPREWSYDSYLGEQGALPSAVMHDVGLDGNIMDTLINMNDDSHESFATIAQWIEDNL